MAGISREARAYKDALFAVGLMACTQCGMVKPLGQFGPGPRRGLRSYCLRCGARYCAYIRERGYYVKYNADNHERLSEYVAKYNAENREHRSEYNREWRAQNPDKVVAQQTRNALRNLRSKKEDLYGPDEAA